MNTRTLASRFVVVVTGISVTASALAQVSPEATYPATPAATGAYDPAQTAAPAPADPAAQTYTPPVAAQAPAPDAQAPAYSPPPVAQAPAYPAPDAQTPPATQPPAYQPPPQPAPAQTPTYPAPAQVPAYPAPAATPGAPAPAPYGTAPYGAPPNVAMPNGIMQPVGQMPAPSRVRNAFAATLGAILQNAASAGTLGLSQLVTGSITAWFNRKANRLAGQPYGVQPAPGYAPAYPTTDPYSQVPGQAAYPTQQTYGTQPAYPTAQQPYGTQPTTQPYGQTTPAYPGQQTYSTQSTYPTQPGQATQPYNPTQTYGTAPAYGASQPGAYAAATTDPYGMSPYGATSYYDPQTGQQTQAINYSTGSGTSSADLYAGIAYEVHAMRPGGAGAVPINPATYEFHTGDRFLVHYRPSMPGRMEVYNVNPLGQTTLIDSVNMAAGQLSTLGPYEFAANKGDESLRLVLSPCATPQLLTASRDIINVSNTVQQPSMQSGYGAQLGSCSALTTRGVEKGGKGGVRTRDIRNVALDGGTSFALDPLSRQELTSGNVAPREVTIVFHHR
jgi:hypothetical protein